jgi:hypothetical protein
MIKRAGTHGLPPRKVHCQKRVPVTGLEERTAPANSGPTAHGPDPAPLTPWLPLSLESRGIYDLGLMIYDLKKKQEFTAENAEKKKLKK